jgi:hypothetical protein
MMQRMMNLSRAAYSFRNTAAFGLIVGSVTVASLHGGAAEVRCIRGYVRPRNGLHFSM